MNEHNRGRDVWVEIQQAQADRPNVNYRYIRSCFTGVTDKCIEETTETKRQREQRQHSAEGEQPQTFGEQFGNSSFKVSLDFYGRNSPYPDDPS